MVLSLEYISNFADQAVVLPLASVVAIAFGIAGWWRGLLAWVVSVGVTLGTMLVLKIVGVMLAFSLGGAGVASPSGHVASACVVYGGLAVLLLRGRLPDGVIALIPTAVVVVVGYTRVALMAHSTVEVVVGALVGCAGVVGMAALAGHRPRMQAWPVLAATACTMLVFNGLHVPAEQAIQNTFSVR